MHLDRSRHAGGTRDQLPAGGSEVGEVARRESRELVVGGNRGRPCEATHQGRFPHTWKTASEQGTARSAPSFIVPPSSRSLLSPFVPPRPASAVYPSEQGINTHINPTLAIPVLLTSNPTPPPPPPPVVGVSSSRLSLASLALSCPRWKDVALLRCVFPCVRKRGES